MGALFLKFWPHALGVVLLGLLSLQTARVGWLKDELALVRDPFACKPAVVAENDDYVAIASEFRSLAYLPGINDADVFEPGPEEIFVWNKKSVAAKH